MADQSHTRLYSNLGQVIRTRRKELDLSQEDLAKTSHVDRAFISNIEQGKRKPSFGTIALLAIALKLKYSRLVSKCEALDKQSSKAFPTADMSGQNLVEKSEAGTEEAA